MLNDLLKNIAAVSFGGSLIAVFLLLLKPVLQRFFSKKWNYYIWLLVIARLILPFGLSVEIPADIMSNVVDFGFSATESIPYTDVSDLYGIPETVIPQESAQHIAPELLNSAGKPKGNSINFKSLTEYMGIVWLVTAMLFFIKKLTGYLLFLKFIKRDSKPVNDSTVTEICTEMCGILGIGKKMPVLRNRTVVSPMLIGLLKPMIVLPDTQSIDIAQFKYVFLHELTHYKRRDIFLKWLAQIAVCLHWFNPIAYRVGKEFGKACELSCDESIMAALTQNERRSYGDTLLRSFEMSGGRSIPVISLSLTENSRFMKERLGAVMKFRKKSLSTGCASVALASVLCVCSAFTGVSAETSGGNTGVHASGPAAVTESDLHNIKPILNTLIGARAYSGQWAAATGIEGKTYIGQLDQKIKWIEDFFNEKNESFMLNETISEEEATNTLGIRYMYENSTVYREMSQVGDTFQILPYNSSFSRSGSNKFLERSVFYADKPSILNLSVSYELSEGYYAFFIVSPDGEIAYGVNDPQSNYSNEITLPLETGLWSFVILGESDTGAFKGTQKIEGKISDTDVLTTAVYTDANADSYEPSFGGNMHEFWIGDIPSAGADGFVKIFGKRHLTESSIVNADISWKGDGYVNFFFTKNNLSEEDVKAIAIPSGSDGITYNPGGLYDLGRVYMATSPEGIDATMSVTEEGDYYFYLVAKSGTGITDIRGSILFSE